MLSDALWKKIEYLLPAKAGDTGRTARDDRRCVEAVLRIARTKSNPCSSIPLLFVRTDMPPALKKTKKLTRRRSGAPQGTEHQAALGRRCQGNQTGNALASLYGDGTKVGTSLEDWRALHASR